MDENRIAGSAKNLGGQVQEEFGRVTGDTATQAKGSPTACTARLKTFTDKRETLARSWQAPPSTGLRH
jgi:uncharacterized protein YjbJ (UPF0337 family)